jgi:hypothetical protein
MDEFTEILEGLGADEVVSSSKSAFKEIASQFATSATVRWLSGRRILHTGRWLFSVSWNRFWCGSLHLRPKRVFPVITPCSQRTLGSLTLLFARC